MLTDAQRAALTARVRGQRRDAPPPAAPVVPLGRAGAPAYAFHAVGGSVHEYAALARALDGVYRLAGVQARRPAGDLAAMAVRYAELLHAEQPHGPYRLLGWSMGGVVAYETARRLAADGADVAQVVLIDAPCRPVSRYADSPAGLTALFVADVLRGAGPGPAADPGAPPAEQLRWLAARLAAPGPERAALAADLDRRWAVFAANTAALAGYRPSGPLDAPAVLVQAAGSPDSVHDWAALFGGPVTTVRSGAGHHDCLRPPAVTAIAAAVRAAADPRELP